MRAVRAWALVELGDHEAIDVSVRKRNALKALEDAVYQGWVRRSAALTSDEFRSAALTSDEFG
jgi:hypothetical protein